MVRRVLKDNKVPGASRGTKAAEAPSRGAGSAVGFLGESQAGLREGQVIVWTGVGGWGKWREMETTVLEQQ